MKKYLIKLLIAIPSILFIISIPTLLITTDLRFAVNDVRLYEYGFDKYDVSLATGLDSEELREIALEIIDYYNSDEELIDVDVYTEREILHMKDVKSLVRLDYTLQLISLIYIILFVVVGFVLKRGQFWRQLVGGMMWGGWFTISLIVSIGIWALIDFDSLFYLFHIISFNNDLWRLSSADYMLPMFPESFFNDAALFIAGAVILEAIIVMVAAYIILVIRRRIERKAILQNSRNDDIVEA